MDHLNVFFLPMLAHGHMIPMLDMAKLFASRGVNATIITTTRNAPVYSKAVEQTRGLGFELSLEIIKFPSVSGLPKGCENTDQLTGPEMFPIFFAATAMLTEQVEGLLREYQPHCLVADIFFPWAIDVASKFDIPTLYFHGTGFFALCASEQVRVNRPFKDLLSDSDTFVVPNFPHVVKLLRSQVSPHERAPIEGDMMKMFAKVRESEMKCFGIIVNSFVELEPDYADHYRNVLKRKAWHIGPVSLINRGIDEKAERGKKAAIDGNECLKWLDSKKPNSVLYVCFGSACNFPAKQLYDLAIGLENSGQDFVWVVRRVKKKNDKDNDDNEEWLPERYEERVRGKGLIIRGWAPQVLILDHESIGGFVSHCGWNSILEGICAGVPFVTWPLFADQFFNEKLLTDILRIGVSVGAKEWVEGGAKGGVGSEAVEKAVKELMVGEEAEERREGAKALKEMAKKAVDEGGSSYLDLNALLKDISVYHS